MGTELGSGDEQEFLLLENQLRLVVDAVMAMPNPYAFTAKSPEKFSDSSQILSFSDGFVGYNLDKPDKLGQKVSAGKTSAVILVPPLASDYVHITINFRNLRSYAVARSMKVYFNGTPLQLTRKDRKTSRLASYFYRFFPKAFKLGPGPYVFRSQLVGTSGKGVANMLAFHFDYKVKAQSNDAKPSLARISSISFKNSKANAD